jgi:hypothetical protein
MGTKADAHEYGAYGEQGRCAASINAHRSRGRECEREWELFLLLTEIGIPTAPLCTVTSGLNRGSGHGN